MTARPSATPRKSPAEWLLEIASKPGDAPRMIDFAGLVLYEFPNLPPKAPRVWVEIRAFILACAIVAEQREAAEAPARVH